MIDRDLIVALARDWLGTPYHHRARVKGVGVDCATLLIGVFHEAGMIPDIRPEYPPDWHLHRDEERYLGWLRQYGDEILVGDSEPGDVLVWRFGRTYSHGAIYVGDGEIIHALRKARCVTAGRVDEADLASRPCKAWRVRGSG